MKQPISAHMQKRLVALFFLFLTVLGLCLGGGYGVPWDEKNQQVTLKSNLYEYGLILLGEDNSWIRYAHEMGTIPISKSVERDHGSALFYPMAFIYFIEDAHLVMLIWHTYVWLLFMLGVIAIYIIMREIGLPRMLSCMASLLLYLSPRFFAEGHYNNKDVLLLSLALCIFAFAARLSRDRRFLWVLLYSLFGAVTANLKIIGFFAWGLAGIAVLWRWILDKSFGKRDIRLIAAGVGIFLAAYFVITPALWRQPLELFQYLIDNMNHFSRWEGNVLFQGTVYHPANGESLPWYYLPKFILMTVPVAYLLLALVGQICAIIMCVKGDRNRPILITMTVFWIFPLVYAMLSSPLVYNGWRHFYFVNAGLVVMGGIGLWWFYRLTRKTRILKATFALAAASVFVFQGASILINHPYQYAYYNVLAGNVQGQYELDYWTLSSYNALQKLATSTTRNQNLPLVFSTTQMDFTSIDYPLQNNYDALPKELRDKMEYESLSEDAPYLIYNTSYLSGNDPTPPAGYTELFSIVGYHQVLAVVYEKVS